MWALFICAGISAMGCGFIHSTLFPSQAECERALSVIRFDTPPAGHAGRSALAYCKPADPK